MSRRKLAAKTVLCADMVLGDREKVENHLTSRVGRLIRTEAGQEALALLRKDRPDVVIAGTILADMTGCDLVRRIKAHDPAMPVIMHTEFDRWMGMECGTTILARKPMRPGEMDLALSFAFARE